MCGIVGAIAQRDVAPILLEGLRRLEYRGYDSAGVAVLDDIGNIQRRRALGKVQQLASRIDEQPLFGHIGIAHTRWATHGEPSEANAHPHLSGEKIALVHNGIIENHLELRAELQAAGYAFTSATDTEVIVHLIEQHYQQHADLLAAVQAVTARLEGAYALAVMAHDQPDQLICTRSGSPLVLGVGIGEHFVASDVAALLPVTQQFVYLEEGDTVILRRDNYTILAANQQPVERPVKTSQLSTNSAERGDYRHFMQKEIFEQPEAIRRTLEGRLTETQIPEAIFGPRAAELLKDIRGVHIIACGTSYHAGLIARYWIESLVKLPCVVEIASEYRYRQPVVQPGRLFVTISQSGETADTLAALRLSKELGYLASLAICNVPESSLVRESDLSLMTYAGPEIGVASTKAFTTQLTVLLMLVGVLRRCVTGESEEELVVQLRQLPEIIEKTLLLDEQILTLAEDFIEKQHALFLGRGVQYPVAMEGALKLKEISYIHAEAYAAGELKHGPLALVDADMPVVAVAPQNELLEKLKSNLEEVRARGGQLFVFADEQAKLTDGEGVKLINLPHINECLQPILYTIPLQLLSYHVAVLKGTDVDQPRNLAKSVTVE